METMRVLKVDSWIVGTNIGPLLFFQVRKSSRLPKARTFFAPSLGADSKWIDTKETECEDDLNNKDIFVEKMMEEVNDLEKKMTLRMRQVASTASPTEAQDPVMAKEACNRILSWMSAITSILFRLAPVIMMGGVSEMNWRKSCSAIGQLLIRMGVHLCRMTDFGSEDPFYSKGHAIFLILEDGKHRRAQHLEMEVLENVIAWDGNYAAFADPDGTVAMTVDKEDSTSLGADSFDGAVDDDMALLSHMDNKVGMVITGAEAVSEGSPGAVSADLGIVEPPKSPSY